MPSKLTQEEFIRRCQAKHGDRYFYGLAFYSRAHAKVKIGCRTHGWFDQIAMCHMQGCGCPKCGMEILKKSRLLPQEVFLRKARKIHGDKYDYSKIEYKNTHAAVCIVCPEHGEFHQSPNTHTKKSATGCRKCGFARISASKRKWWDRQVEGLKKKFVGRTIKTFEIQELLFHAGKRYWSCRCTVCGKACVRSTGRIHQMANCPNCQGLDKGRVGLLERFNGYRAGAAKLGRKFNLKIEQFKRITSLPCHYCGKPPGQLATKHRWKKENRISHWGDYLYNGIDRKDNRLGYVAGNCLPCCKVCNRAKSSMGYDQFVEWLDGASKFRRILPAESEVG